MMYSLLSWLRYTLATPGHGGKGGNSLAFIKRLLPPVLLRQTVEVGLSWCSLLLQKLQVSLSFGVETPTFPLTTLLHRGSPERNHDSF